MGSTSFLDGYKDRDIRNMKIASCRDIGELKKKREQIGDEGKFRRMCDFDTLRLGYNVLHLAAGAGELDVCKFLVDEVGVDIHLKTDMGYSPFLCAVNGGDLLTAEYFIERGAQITNTDSDGFTALHLALGKDLRVNKGLLIMLLKNGADIEADSVYGTPLNCAARLGENIHNMKILLQNNAEPNSVSKCLGISPLVSAIIADTNKVECMELLLKAGADPNMSANGLSPLAYAVEAKQSNCCIDALLAAGADVDAVSSNGLRPIEHAAFMGNLEAIWMLILARPRLLATPNFSLLNLLKSITVVQADEKRALCIRNLHQKGDNAWDNQDYSCAIASYSEAIHYNPGDEKLVANRGLCWARLGEGAFALNDAQICIGLEPNWGKAHLREATAWHLLKSYHVSSNTFKRAFELDPENEEID